MGLNRNLLMGQNVDLKNIKAMMTIGGSVIQFGFQDGKFGSLSPNPLPNGVLVNGCFCTFTILSLKPSSIKSCTINNITFNDKTGNSNLFSYLKQNVGKTIPVIFHFD